MRIVITSNYELGNETGSAKVTEEMASKLSKKNEVLFICLGTKFNIHKKSNNLEVATVTSIKINGLYVPIISPILMYQIFTKLDAFKPNIVHAQNSILVSALVQMWAKLNKVPFIVTFHHVPTEPIKHLVPNLSKNMLVSLVQEIYKNTSLKQFLKKTDLVIVQNDLICRSIKSISESVKVEFINNGVEIKKLNKIKPRIAKNRFNFVFLGSYTPRKNQLFLIKTFKYLPSNFNLNLYGSFKTGGVYLEKIKELIKKIKLKNVNINDFNNDIYSVFRKNDYLLSGSKKEAQSLVVIQSLAAGKPVIGLSNETTDELINNLNGLVVKQKISPKMFSSLILNFINKSNYKDLSIQCKKGSKRFDIDFVVSKIENCYQRLSKSSR